MAKYKVGDKVRVRTGLKGNKYYDGLLFATTMEEVCGKELTVELVNPRGRYKVEENHWTFNDAMLEDVTPKSHKYKVGDKVRIRTDLVGGENYGDLFCAHGMEKFRGKEMTVGKVRATAGRYNLVDGDGWVFSEAMFEETPCDAPHCEEPHTQTFIRVTVFNHYWCPTKGVEAILIDELPDGRLVIDLGFKAPFTTTCDGRCKSGTAYFEHKKNVVVVG